MLPRMITATGLECEIHGFNPDEFATDIENFAKETSEGRVIIGTCVLS